MDPLDPLDLEEELAGLQASDFLDLSTWSVGLRRGHSGRGPFIEGWIQLSADITAHLFAHQNSFSAQRCPGWMHLGFQISRNLGKYAVITTAACGGYSEPTANQRIWNTWNTYSESRRLKLAHLLPLRVGYEWDQLPPLGSTPPQPHTHTHTRR